MRTEKQEMNVLLRKLDECEKEYEHHQEEVNRLWDVKKDIEEDIRKIDPTFRIGFPWSITR